MVILLVILAALCIYRVDLSRFHESYITKESTDSIKGIFTIVILYSHLRGYLPPQDDMPWIDSIFYTVINLIGQLMVVMFLFYSGYGILESYQHKSNYKEHFFRRRFLKTLFNFDIAVVLYAILALFLDKDYSIKNYILSFTGWDSIGNSNWFVFDILVLYLMSLVCLHIFKPSKLKLIVITMYVLTGLFLVVLFVLKDRSYWYDTIMAFPSGMLFSVYKNKFEQTVHQNVRFHMIFAAGLILFTACLIYGGGVGQLINGMLFPFIMIMITTKVKIDNKILRWLGQQCFAVYILQRIPMIMYSELGLNDNWILFSITVIPTTLCLAALFNAFTDRIGKRLFY